MMPTERWADIVKLMRSHGWEATTATGQDAVYMRHPGRQLGLWLDDGGPIPAYRGGFIVPLIVWWRNLIQR